MWVSSYSPADVVLLQASLGVCAHHAHPLLGCVHFACRVYGCRELGHQLRAGCMLGVLCSLLVLPAC